MVPAPVPAPRRVAPVDSCPAKTALADLLVHVFAEAAADARQIKDKLCEKLGAPVFIDSDDLMDLRQLQLQVTQSDVLVLFQTRNLLTRPWCLVEIFTALKNEVPIVAVCVAGAFPYDFADAQKFLDNFEVELEARNPGAGEVVRQCGIELGEMAELLRESVPFIISKRWEPGASQAVLDAQLEDIVQAMESAKQQHPTTNLLASTMHGGGLADNLL